MGYPIQEYPSPRIQPGDVDASGRLLPLSEAQLRSRLEAIRAALDEIETIGPDETDADEIWAEVFKGIDSSRPDRPLFGE